MKRPKYFCETMQQASDCGINPYALKLLAESFADRNVFGDDNVVLLAHAHNGQEVWFVMTKTRPCRADFDTTGEEPAVESNAAAAVELLAALEELVKLQAHYAKLLNAYDGGERIPFESAAQWLARLVDLKTEKGQL